jgi:uncharacterized protein HemX
MPRWLATFGGVAIGAVLSAATGYWLWGRDVARLPQIDLRLQTLQAEMTELRQAKLTLEQRVGQITKEQERLAQENDLLRTQCTSERLLSESTRDRDSPPPLPPK